MALTAHTASAPTHRRRRVRLVALALALAFVLTACLNGSQTRLAELVNRDRASAGRGSVQVDAELVDKAQAWAEKIARDGRLSHSNLASGVSSCWRTLSENVGYASSIDELHRAFMASPSHRANILDPSKTHIGVGVVYRDNLYWGVHVFRQAC